MARAKTKTNVSPVDASKFRKAGEPIGMIEIKVGRNKFEVVAAEGITLDSGDGYAYISIPAVSGVYAMNPSLKTATAVESDAELKLALKGIRDNARPSSAGGGKAKADQPTLTPELENLLKQIPTGFKIATNKDGSYGLVKSRQRRSSEEVAAEKAAKADKPKSGRGRKPAASV